MLFQCARAKLVPGSWLAESKLVSEDASQPPTAGGVGCRLVQIILLLYLLPAFLVVMIVGILGVALLGFVNLLAGLRGTSAR